MTDTDPPKRDVWTRRLLAAATMGASAAYLLRENADGDIWWQAAIGKAIIATGAVPRLDSFSALGQGRPYHDSHWLFQVMMGAADHLAGMIGVGLAAVVLWAATLFLCFRAVRGRVQPPAACLLLLAVVLGVSDRFIPRPDAVTCLMIVTFYLLLERNVWERWAGIALVAALQIIWANSHGLFIVGPFMVLSYWLDAMARRSSSTGPGRLNLSILLALVSTASLSTPFGPAGWRYASLLFAETTSSGPTFFAFIEELAPTFSRASLTLPDFWIFAGFLGAWLATVVAGFFRRSLPIPRLLITAGLCAAACTGRRNMPLFILAAAPFIAECAPTALRLPRTGARTSWAVIGLAVVAAWLPVSGKYFEAMRLPTRFGLGASASVFPLELPSFLARSGFKGQMYNSAYLGGFSLYHGYRPLIDTRWEVYGQQVLRDFFMAAVEPSRWESMVAVHDIRGVLLAHASAESKLLPRLAADRSWRLVWYDNAASFWVRRDLLPAMPTLSPDGDDRVPRPKRVEESYQLAYFYHVIGAYRRALESYQDALARWGVRDDTLGEIGRLQASLGLFREAEATLRRLLARDRTNSLALRTLASIALMRGDAASAESFALRALRADPQDPEAQAILQELRRTGKLR